MIYKNVSIEGPNGTTIRSGDKPGNKGNTGGKENTGSKGNEKGDPEGYSYKGCFKDTLEDRVFPSMSTSDNMTAEVTRTHAADRQ